MEVTYCQSQTEDNNSWFICCNRREAHDTGGLWLHLEVKRSKVKVTRSLNAVTENQPRLRNRKAYKLQTFVRMDYDDPHHW